MRGGEQSPDLDFLFLFYQEKRKERVTSCLRLFFDKLRITTRG
jgi:hypothetical protein